MTEVIFYWQKQQNQQNRILCYPLGDLGVTCMVHLWLVGKRMIDFLLALNELFRQLTRLRHYEQTLDEIVVFKRWWVILSANFRRKGSRPPTTFGVSKLESLGYHVVLFV